MVLFGVRADQFRALDLARIVLLASRNGLDASEGGRENLARRSCWGTPIEEADCSPRPS